jgi:hypothetical protein
MRRDGVRNRTANAIALCDFFGIFSRKNQAKGFDIPATAANAWDGTLAHAELLVDLLEAVARYKVERRPRRG